MICQRKIKTPFKRGIYVERKKERVRVSEEEDLCKSGSADACFHTRDCAYKTIKIKTKKRLNFSFSLLFLEKCSSNFVVVTAYCF